MKTIALPRKVSILKAAPLILLVTALFIAFESSAMALSPKDLSCGTDAVSGERAQSGASDEREAVSAETDRLIGEAELSKWDEFLEFSRDGGEALFGSMSASEIAKSIAESEVESEPRSVFEKLLSLMLPGLRKSAAGLLPVAAICMISGVCAIVFKNDGMDRPVQFVLSSVSVLSVTGVFASLAAKAAQACSKIASFCEAAAPPLSILLAASGAPGASAALTPKLSLLAAGISALMDDLVFPMLLAAGVITVLCGIGEFMRLSNAVSLLIKSAKWLMGLASVVYTGIVFLSGAAAAASDGVGARTAKYAIDRLLPVGGSVVSATMDTAASGAYLAKNAVGSAALVVLALALIRPALTLLGGMLAFRAAAAVCEPFSGTGIPAMLGGIADVLSYMLAACVLCASMLALTLVMMISAGGSLL